MQNARATHVPKSVKCGSGLGQWIELDGAFINEIVIGGAKLYGYDVSNGKVVVTQQGIILDLANCKLVCFETMNNMIYNDRDIKSASRYQLCWCKQSQHVITRCTARSIHSTIGSKREVDRHVSKSCGSEETSTIVSSNG